LFENSGLPCNFYPRISNYGFKYESAGCNIPILEVRQYVALERVNLNFLMAAERVGKSKKKGGDCAYERAPRSRSVMTTSPEPKKRRFFLEDPEVKSKNNPESSGSFDASPAWEALRPLVLPETDDQTLADLYQKSNGNLEAAANLFWENQVPEPEVKRNVINVKDNSLLSNTEEATISRSGSYVGDIMIVGEYAVFTVCDIETELTYIQ
jgi:hypothetical protein